MPIVRKMPTSQCNSAKTITVLKELFAEHGIPEEIRSNNGLQFASHLFDFFCKEVTCKLGSIVRSNLFRYSMFCKQLSQYCDCLGTVTLWSRHLPYYRSAYPCQVLWTGSISRFVSIQEYPSWFTSTITCWDALSTCSMHNCATKDQAQRPLCSSWMWRVRGTCNPECS